jgi:hypothetical protein
MVAAVGVIGIAAAAYGAQREAGDPIRLVWMEGDVAGMTPINSPDGRDTIGFVEYHQRRRGDVLEAVRVSRFRDGSSDEDQAEARVGSTLQALRGRSIIRDTRGNPIVDLHIDVVGGQVSGFYVSGGERTTVEEKAELPAGTYWGPLIFIVLKNFDENASDDRLVFTTIAPTPKPRVINMELLRTGRATVERPGGQVDAVRFILRPTINWLLDPIVHRLAPETDFFVDPGKPPALARYTGPRNYGGQEIRLE